MRPKESCLFPVLFFIFLFVFPCYGQWQCIISGNWQGAVLDISNAENPKLTSAWKMPELISSLKKRLKDTLSIGVGNDCHPQSPVTFLWGGGLEEALSGECGFDVHCLGPGDLTLLKNWKREKLKVFDRVWTNCESVPEMHPFSPFKIVQVGSRKMAVGCLIGQSAVLDTPIIDKDGYTVEDPLRGLHRLKSLIGNVDDLFLVCHVDSADLERIEAELETNERILWVPTTEISEKIRHRMRTRKKDHIWLIPPGNKAMFLARFENRLGGRIDENSHQLPLEGTIVSQEMSPDRSFSGHQRQKLFQPLKVVTTEILPRTIPYQFSANLQAEYARSFMRSEFALIGIGLEEFKTERILQARHILQYIPPRFLRDYYFSGSKLKKVVEKILQLSNPLRIGVAGGEVSFLGGQLKRIKIGGKEVDDLAGYRVTLDSGLFADPNLQTLLESCKRVGVSGFTLWDAWFEGISQNSYEKKIIRKN